MSTANEVNRSSSRTHAAPLHSGKFVIYDLYDNPVTGWTDGVLWNGWATPHFEYEEASRIVDMHNRLEALDPLDAGKAWYDAEHDQFCFVLAGSDGEVEYYPGYEREAGGEPRRLYGIGAWVWVWEEYEEV